jgi:Tfp pilus assembly protein PilV
MRAKGTRIGLRRKAGGAVFMEVLVAMLILSLCILGVMNLWAYSMNLTQSTDRYTVAYDIARLDIERIKGTGFYNTTEYASGSPLYYYYDVAGGSESTTQGSSIYRAAITVVSSQTETQNGVTRPSDDAIRTVTVTVTRLDTGETLVSNSTYLVRAGV